MNCCFESRTIDKEQSLKAANGFIDHLPLFIDE